MIDLKNSILNNDDAYIERVDVSKYWGDVGKNVYIKALDGLQRDDFEASMIQGKGKRREVNYKNLRARLLVRTICDKDGTLIFTPSDAESLGKKSAAALDKLYTVASKISGLSADDQEELLGNSDSDQSDASI